MAGELRSPARRALSWKAGFVSRSDSYKAWIGSEEAKQTSEASLRGQIKFQLSPAPWPVAGSFRKKTGVESLPRSRFGLRRNGSGLCGAALG